MASSVPCKFFSRGYCRNGNNCRFLHDGQENSQQNSPSTYRYIRPSALGENRSQTQNNYSSSRRHEQDREIRQTVLQDVSGWEDGNQWLFTCFAPAKDGENFPEFYDISPEELRWNAYEAEKQGTLQFYNEEISNLASDIKRKRSVLKNPTSSVMETLIKCFNHSVENEMKGTLQQQNVFGSSTVSSNSASSFSFKLNTGANRNSSTSLFGNQANVPTNPASIFGGNAATTGGFGGNTTTGTFGGNASTTGSFGGNATTTGSFGGNASTTGNFGASPIGQSAFGQNQQQVGQTNSLFNQSQNNSFPNQQQTASSFSFSSAPFQNNSTSSGSFGFSSVNNQPNQSNSLFGGTGGSSSNPSLGFRNSEENSTKYSKMENLTEDEKQQFLNPSFTIGLIPENPPPHEFIS